MNDEVREETDQDRRPIPPQRLPLGIVLERRASDHPWQTHRWQVLGVLPGGAPNDGWRLLRASAEGEQFYAGSLDLILHADEAPGYRYNLAGGRPALYVVLRPSDGLHDVAPFLVTACPVEAQDYMTSGDEIVEAVPMPEPVAAWIGHFLELCPPPPAFTKRRKTPKSDRSGRNGDPRQTEDRRGR